MNTTGLTDLITSNTGIAVSATVAIVAILGSMYGLQGIKGVGAWIGSKITAVLKAR